VHACYNLLCVLLCPDDKANAEMVAAIDAFTTRACAELVSRAFSSSYNYFPSSSLVFFFFFTLLCRSTPLPLPLSPLSCHPFRHTAKRPFENPSVRPWRSAPRRCTLKPCKGGFTKRRCTNWRAMVCLSRSAQMRMSF
jgi:hypothetical protein